jgi:Predicted PP-loop superfamily ATPase
MSQAIVLMSGGLDSMATADFLAKAGHHVTGLFVDYGQPSRARERVAARAVATSLDMPLRTCVVPGLRPPKPAEMPGRNGLLLHVALHVSTPFAGLIALGIHSGSGYSDCTPTFVEASQAVFDIYTAGTVSVTAPFVEMTKRDIWEYCKEEQLPIDLSYSCELGLDSPCGRCSSCDDRQRLIARS